MLTERSINRALFILLLVSLMIRAFIAGFIELGNDEVYYWTYARFPDWSHFDHPAMVGLVIQLFTLDLSFENEFFIRLGPVIIGTVNTWIIFMIGKKIRDSLTGLYAALLYSASFYCLILTGTFILPDTPQGLFWLATLYFLLGSLPDKTLGKASRFNLLMAGITTGLALLSKYHSAFLIAGALLYILFFNRRWLRAKETYLAFFIAVLFFIPVLIWNFQNQFISFSFHEGRINPAAMRIRWDYFTMEITGQLFYNNPVNVIIILSALIGLIRRKIFLDKEYLRLILFLSIPLLLIFIGFSFYSRTFPHWTGPAYYGLILISAAWLSSREYVKIVPWPIRISLILILLLLMLGTGQINYGWIPLKKWFHDDFSSQLYGWKQLGEKFKPIAKQDIREGIMADTSPIITFRWFPAANFDYYVARQLNKKVYAYGPLTRIHKYFWINKQRGNIEKNSRIYYIALSDDYQDPVNLYAKLFDSISVPDTIKILRRGENIREAYVYRLFGLKRGIRFNDLSSYLEPSLERIHFWQWRILNDSAWSEEVRKKSIRHGRPFEEEIWDEGKWMAEEEMRK